MSDRSGFDSGPVHFVFFKCTIHILNNQILLENSTLVKPTIYRHVLINIIQTKTFTQKTRDRGVYFSQKSSIQEARQWFLRRNLNLSRIVITY